MPDFSAAARPVGKPGNYYTDLLRLAAHGLTLGFSDEILGAANAMGDVVTKPGTSFSDAYKQRVDEERTLLDQAHANTGNMGLAAEIAGGLVLPGGVVARAGSKVGAGLLRAMSGGLMTGEGIGGTLGGSAAVGGAFGGIQRAGDAEVNPNASMGDALRQRLAAGLEGAGQGAMIGGALPMAGAAMKPILGPVASTVGNMINTTFRPAATAETRVLQAVDRMPGGGLMSQKLDNMQMQMQDAQAVGVPATMADLGGYNTQRAARSIVTLPGEGSANMVASLSGRQLNSPDRVTQYLSEAMADPSLFYKTLDKIDSERSDLAGPLYKKAFDENPMVNTEPVLRKLNDLLSTTAGKTRSALTSVAKELVTTPQVGDGTINTANAVKVGLVSTHAVKEMIDDMVGVAMRSGENAQAGKLLEVKRTLLDQMKGVSPDYDHARDIYAGRSALMNAMEDGASAINSKSQVVAKDLERMPDSERQMWVMGLARSLRDKMDNAPDGADVVKRIFGTPRMREVIREAIGNDRAYARFANQMSLESRMTETNQMARGGSQTANKLAEVGEITPDLSAIGHLMHGNVIKAAGSVVGGPLARMSGMSPAVASDMGDMLMSYNPNVVDRLRARQSALEQSAARGAMGRRLITQALATHPDAIPQ
ncbi:MAG: hypothetical protein KGL35_33020 [Bradyrhizobium sp.]|nr:hypothetical protein [Bradyrhizobium sp.]